MKMESQKIVNLLDAGSGNDLPRLVTKNGLKFTINPEEITVLRKK